MEHVQLLKEDPGNQVRLLSRKELLSLHRSGNEEWHCYVPTSYKNKLMAKYKLDELPLLHRVALLPPEIQNQIFTPMLQVMFEKSEQAIEIFCSKPIIKAFQLYCDIKKSITKDELIIPIYVMDENKQNILLSRLNPWYGDYIDPIMYDDEKIEEDEKEYFAGRKVWHVPARLRDRIPPLCGGISCVSTMISIGGMVLLGVGERLGWVMLWSGGGVGCLFLSTVGCAVRCHTEKVEL